MRGNRRRAKRFAAAQDDRASKKDGGVRELQEVLDEELTALPAKYREALILCDLEGHTREEAARILSTSAGTVATWVARGRRRLRDRLVRRGVTLGAGGVGAAVAHGALAGQSLPVALIQETCRHAELFLLAGSIVNGTTIATRITSLAKGELNNMFLSKLSTTVCLAALLAVALFGGTVASSLVPGLIGSASAATVFFDDFEDGSATDGNPVTWAPIPAWPLTTFSVSGGNLRVGVSTSEPNHTGLVAVHAVALGNMSIRTQVRFEGQSNPDEGPGVFVRGDTVNNRAHAFEIASDGGLWFGISGSGFQRIDSNLRPTQEDVILQLDAIGNTITAWAWRAGDPMPTTPAFTAITNLLSTGVPGVYKSASVSVQGMSSGTAIFRHVHVADIPIPEPPAIALGSLGAIALASLAFRIQLCRVS
jgi:hypothetical protein